MLYLEYLEFLATRVSSSQKRGCLLTAKEFRYHRDATEEAFEVFEWCVLIGHKLEFATSLQFGFKQGLSTDLCTGLKENVNVRYNVNGTEGFLGCKRAI